MVFFGTWSSSVCFKNSQHITRVTVVFWVFISCVGVVTYTLTSCSVFEIINWNLWSNTAFLFDIFLLFSPPLCSHDFIGEFSTSYRELSRGQSQFNVYEVSVCECVFLCVSLHVPVCVCVSVLNAQVSRSLTHTQ